MTLDPYAQIILNVKTHLTAAVNNVVEMEAYVWWASRKQVMFAIINMNVKVDVANKENAERLKTNASFPAPRTVTAHIVIAVVMGTA